MNRRRRPHAHANHDRWLVSYADFITLLFAFFVVLYASSQVDNMRMSRLAETIEGAFHELGAFPAPTSGLPGNSPRIPDTTNTFVSGQNLSAADQLAPDVIPDLKHDLEQALAAEIENREIALRIGPEGLVVSLREIGFFESGSAILKPGSEGPIARIVDVLRERRVSLRVEGHTDNVPIHNSQFTSNWELSTARATEMIKLLISRYGFSPHRLSAAGYGEFHPLASNESFEGRRQNRRLDLVILVAPSPHLSTTRGEASRLVSEAQR